jgi:tellurite resistance protein
LAQSCIDAHALTNLSPLLGASDAKSKLKENACSTQSHMAKHSVDSAELVVEGEIFPATLHCLKDADGGVRKAAAALVREVVKQTQELAQLVVKVGAAPTRSSRSR